MKVSVFNTILPRLEISFLEEWIIHYLNLGFDKIYIYNNGTPYNKNLNGSYRPYGDVRQLKDEEIGIKWEKKPDLDYLDNISDEEIHNRLYSLQKKYKKYLKVVNWRFGKETKYLFPYSQILAYQHCVKNNKSDWWLHIDPDEYLVLYNHENIKNFINDNPLKHRFLFSQKVFDKRVVGKPVREIFNWGYQDPVNKTLVQNPLFMTNSNTYRQNKQADYNAIFYDCHQTYSLNGAFTNIDRVARLKKGKNYKVVDDNWVARNKKVTLKTTENYNNFWIDRKEAEFFHYRGTPDLIGGGKQYSKHKFDKIDKSMEKYIN